MSIEQKNLKSIKAKYPELYDAITNRPSSGRYQIIDLYKNGKLNLIDSQRNVLIYQKQDPYGQVLREIKGRNIKVPNFAIFLGLGFLYNVKAYIDTYINKKIDDFGLVLVEKDIDLFRTILKVADFTAIVDHPRCHLLVGLSSTEVHMKLSFLFRSSNLKSFIKATNFIEESALFAANKEYYLDVIRVYKEASKDVLRHYGNSPLDSLIGIDHTFVNIDEIIYHPGIKDLEGVFKGKPGIVVSTGPSLNKNIHLLEGLENKAVICCPDASVLVLKNRNLKPHMVTSLERVENTAKLFDGLTEDDTKGIYFAGTPVLHPLTYQKWPGKRICVYRNFATFQWLDIERGIIDIGPSAGNMAFEILAYLGCDPIILIGQDLAFAEDGTTHAKGNKFGEKDERDFMKKTFPVPGNYQKEVQTVELWESFRRAYNLSVSRTDAKVINATEGGAKIEGTEVMTFQEAIDKYITDDVNTVDVIESSLRYPTEDEIAENLNKVEMKVEEAKEYIEELSDKFLESGKLADKYLNTVWKKYTEDGEYDFEESQKILNDSSATIALCSSEKFYLILMHYVQSYYIKSVMDIYGVRANSKSPQQEQHDVIVLAGKLSYTLHGLLQKMLPMFYNLEKYLKSKSELKEEKS
ncbi:MAG: motility associated factor glycosyltransferase family protein [Deferribacterales bacterium]